jgi:hypothetical protein
VAPCGAAAAANIRAATAALRRPRRVLCRAKEDEGTPEASKETKMAAARAAVDEFVKPGSVVGLGTGEVRSVFFRACVQS